MPKLLDLTGKVFGRLTVIKRLSPIGTKHIKWECQCLCGETVAVSGNSLKYGFTKSCGCYQKEWTKDTHTKHGHSTGYKISTEYQTWSAMNSRCFNRNNKFWHRYGGRGITVCDRWRDFQNFLQDMGAKPFPRAEIDRINNDGNYEPTNCHWVDHRTNTLNTCRSKSNKRGALCPAG